MNKLLNEARKNKADEFYTQYTDIENELAHYDESLFSGRAVYCPCDDWKTSQFVRYFMDNFQRLGLKSLVSTCLVRDGCGIRYDYDGEKGVATDLIFDGDFRGFDCELIKDSSDIVVTNPPFSLYRNIVEWLEGKKFLILGHMSCITDKRTFRMFRDGEMWYGCSVSSGGLWFDVPDEYPLTAANTRILEDGRRQVNVKGVRWYTNLPNDRKHQPLELHTMDWNLEHNTKFINRMKEFGEPRYRTLDGTDILEVPVSSAIPSDWDGLMAVPTSFIDKWCRDQFRVLEKICKPTIDGKNRFTRLLIEKLRP